MSQETDVTAGPNVSQRAPRLDKPLTFGPVVLTTLISVLWAGTAVGTKIAGETVPPMWLGAIRFASTLVILWLWCRWEGSRLGISRRDWWPATLLGVMLFAQIWTFNVGIEWSSTSHGSVIINTFLFWVAGYEHFVTRTHRLRPSQLVGMLIAFLGVLLLMRQSHETGQPQQPDPATLVGDLVMLLSSVILAVKVCYTKHAVQTAAPGPLMFWHNIVGTLLFALGAVLFEDLTQASYPSRTVWSILFIGPVVSGFCFAAHAWLLSHHSAGSVSVFSFLTPVVGVFVSSLLRGDQLTSSLLACGLCVAAGIALVNWPEGRGEQTVRRNS